MLQVMYGWHGVHLGDDKYHWIHLPQETFENQYQPWKPDAPQYVGEIHDEIDETEVVTILRKNGEIVSEKTLSLRECKVCGVTSATG